MNTYYVEDAIRKFLNGILCIVKIIVLTAIAYYFMS